MQGKMCTNASWNMTFKEKRTPTHPWYTLNSKKLKCEFGKGANHPEKGICLKCSHFYFRENTINIYCHYLVFTLASQMRRSYLPSLRRYLFVLENYI